MFEHAYSIISFSEQFFLLQRNCLIYLNWLVEDIRNLKNIIGFMNNNTLTILIIGFEFIEKIIMVIKAEIILKDKRLNI